MEDTAPGGCSLLPRVIKHFSMSNQRLLSLPPLHPLPAGRRERGNSNDKDGGALRRLRSWTNAYPHGDSVYSLVPEKSEDRPYQNTRKDQSCYSTHTHTSGSANFCMKPKHITHSTLTCRDPSFQAHKKKNLLYTKSHL